MKINLGFFVSKLIRYLNRPALRNCDIHRTAKIGTGSNCISMTIGKYSYMGKNNSISNVEIGSFCSIASYCAIGGGAHDLNAVSTSPIFQEGRNIFRKNLGKIKSNLNKKVIIGNDVWIGEGVFINDGIIIGNGAVIGAHSVVTHNVPPYAIVVGAPAKIIRMRFDKEKINKLEKLCWWNWNDEEILKHDFSSINNFF